MLYSLIPSKDAAKPLQSAQRRSVCVTPGSHRTRKRGVSANPWRAGAWLVTPDAVAPPKRRALLIISHTSAVISLHVFPVAIRSRQAEKIDSTPKRSLHGARQPRHNATLQPPVCSALRFNMGVDGSQRIGAALTPRFGVASASGSRGVARRFSVRCDRHKGLTCEWMGARGLALRLRHASALLPRPV
ncbi:unnamed protein product [Pleuronectes platessa]|uniref:Uncharacterized protein n=1 Tax=Pleuronectes platessa TaxID=8262 RepID=A0A9N7UCC5_PLEPL|nr:unnamed protein product [Pleuronectes platessa]